MKWAVVGLCLLGSIAAICAAFLVNAMRVQASATRSPEPSTRPADVTVLYAKASLPAMTVVDGSLVTVKLMRPEDAPPHYLTNAVDVVGKVLSRPIVEGQPFTTSGFTDAGVSQQVAAVIPAGKRAVGISVTNYAGLEGLLYPGSMVDVMVSLKSTDTVDGMRREPFTATLLENIQVLAIEQQTVVSPGKLKSEFDSAPRSSESHCVTLLVDPHQAKTLQLAMEQGVLSLSLRNPLDSGNADKQPVWLQSLTGQDPFVAMLRKAEAPKASEPEKPRPVEPPHWDTVIMRGNTVETQSFPVIMTPETVKQQETH